MPWAWYIYWAELCVHTTGDELITHQAEEQDELGHEAIPTDMEYPSYSRKYLPPHENRDRIYVWLFVMHHRIAPCYLASGIPSVAPFTNMV